MDIFSPENIIGTFGLLGAATVIFTESGVFFGFFLPGDTLILTAGFFASQGHYSFAAFFFALAIASFLGGIFGYYSGKKAGDLWLAKKDSMFFKKGYIEKAKDFYKKYGTVTVIFARYIPIVRTFAPIVAGIIKMKYSTFIFYNAIGSVLWILSIGSIGYFLGGLLPQDTVTRMAVMVFVFVTVITPFLPKILKRFFRDSKIQTTETVEEKK